MKGRDVKKAMSDSFKSGTLKITEIDEEGNGIVKEIEPSFCDICGKEIENPLDAYSYHLINDDNMMDIVEKLFCCKKCWRQYLLKETKKFLNEQRKGR